MRLEDINLRNPITIAYYDPFSVYPEVQDEFLSKFPLSNLHWKYNQLKPGKSIPLLPVRLKEEVPPLQHKRNYQPTNLVDNVYLRLMFIKADNIDMYRSQVRPLINAWLGSLVKGTDVTWAIILVVRGTKKDKPSTLIKTSLFDKLRMDFGKSGKQLAALNMFTSDLESSRDDYNEEDTNHIFKIKDSYADDLMKLQAYNEIITQFKILILQTFDSRYTTYNNQIDILLKQSHSDSEAHVSEYFFKLKLVYLMCEMRFMTESLELFDNLYEDLKILVSSSEHVFDKKILQLPADLNLNNFSPETSFNQSELLFQFSNYTRENIPVNLFAAKLGLFLSASLLLQSLANFATSISVSSIYILTLLQKLNLFINDISRNYPSSLFLNEWFCAMIDFYLKLPLTVKLTELNEQNLKNGGCNQIATILECMAELRLLRRTITGKLAKKKGLELPHIGFIFEDVSLDNVKHENEDVVLSYAPLIEELNDQESYEKYFETSTIAAIEELVNSYRNKTIDLLSVDLAILHYKRKQYGEALNILLTSHDYFIQNGWNFMGGALLEIYLECVLRLETFAHEDILKTCLKLFATLKENANTRSGINNYNLIKSRQQHHALFERICEESSHLRDVLEYPLIDFFTATLEPFIDSSEHLSDRYAIALKLSNPFAVEIQCQEVRVTLEMIEQNEQVLIFSSSSVVVLASQDHELTLHSRVFRRGTFRVKMIEVQVTDKLLLIQGEENSSDIVADNTVLHREINQTEAGLEGELADNRNPIFTATTVMYPVPGKFRAETVSPQKIELGVAKFDLVIHNGHQEATNINVSLASPTSGVKFDNDDPNFDIQHISAKGSLRRGVTFSYFGDAKILDLQIDIVYEVDGEIYEYHTNEAYDMSLTISISVQDIFRTDAIYSRFQIGSASANVPVRVLDCKFESSDDKYDILSLSLMVNESDPLIIMGEQPAYIFYKVQPKEGGVSSTDILDLTITYSNLQSECLKVSKKLLFEKLCLMNLSKYYYIIVSSLSTLAFNLNHYAVHQEIEVLNVDECSLAMNHVISKYVPEANALQLTDIVMEIFFERKLTIEDADTYFEHQTLYIPVAVPFLGIFHQVEFVFDRKQRYLVGEPIKATLEIKSTSKWSSGESRDILASSSPARESRSLPARDPSEFQFTMLNEEQWLITGFKKHQFSIDENSAFSRFKVCLVPLNVGELQLPKLSIKPIGLKEQNMEIVHENALETILVVPELDSMTFSF